MLQCDYQRQYSDTLLAATIARLSIVESAKYMAPYLVILFIGLLVVTFVPWFTLVLPQTFLS